MKTSLESKFYENKLRASRLAPSLSPAFSHFLDTNSHRDMLGSNCRCGGDVPMFEPKRWFKFEDIDKSIQELRRIFKEHPEWFEVPKPKSDKGKNKVDYSIT